MIVVYSYTIIFLLYLKTIILNKKIIFVWWYGYIYACHYIIVKTNNY